MQGNKSTLWIIRGAIMLASWAFAFATLPLVASGFAGFFANILRQAPSTLSVLALSTVLASVLVFLSTLYLIVLAFRAAKKKHPNVFDERDSNPFITGTVILVVLLVLAVFSVIALWSSRFNFLVLRVEDAPAYAAILIASGLILTFFLRVMVKGLKKTDVLN